MFADGEGPSVDVREIAKAPDLGTMTGCPTALYTWGTGLYGQLALGGTRVARTPQLVECLVEARVFPRKVSCGAYHCAMVSGEYEAFTWGSTAHGCLGRPKSLRQAAADAG